MKRLQAAEGAQFTRGGGERCDRVSRPHATRGPGASGNRRRHAVLTAVTTLLAGLCVPSPGAAQGMVAEQTCGTLIESAEQSGFLPTAGHVTALVLYIRFADDNLVDWGEDWPIDPEEVAWDSRPAWADSLFENTGGTGYPSSPSLTDYFHLMSRGALRLDGDAFPHTIVLPLTIADYVATYGGDSLRIVHEAAWDALDIVATQQFDLSPFADAQTRTLDLVIYVFRGMAHFSDCDTSQRLGRLYPPTGTGFATGELITQGSHSVASAYDNLIYSAASSRQLWVSSQLSRVCASDYPAGSLEEWELDCSGCSTTSVPCSAGGTSTSTCPVQDLSLRQYWQVTAHEIGHALFSNPDTGPLGGATHWYSPNAWCLMHSNGRGTIMNALERMWLGWLEPIEIHPGSIGTWRCYDAVTRNENNWQPDGADSTLFLIYPDDEQPSQYFVLETRRQSTPYADAWDSSASLRAVGQPGRGLLIGHWNDLGVGVGDTDCGDAARSKYTIESAYGLFDEDFEPNPIVGKSRVTGNVGGRASMASSEDAFYPGRNNTFAPYTCPNTNLYAYNDSAQSVPTGLTIKNIANGPDSSLTFTVRWDQPTAAAGPGTTIWNGQVLLTDDFVIPDNATVELTEDAIVLASRVPLTGGQGVDAGRIEIVVEDGGTLDLSPGVGPRFIGSARDSTARIGPNPDGELSFACGGTSVALPYHAAGVADWYGIRTSDVDRLVVGEAVISNARAAVALETDEFPDAESLFGAHRILSGGSFTDLSFDRDVQIGPSDSVVVPQGLRVGFAANRDAAHNNGLGSYPGLSELLVNGPAWFLGTANAPIVLRSDDPDSSGAGLFRDWGGMKVFPESPSGGYCDCERTLEFTHVRDAVRAIAVLDTCLMTLTRPSFENNAEGDVYLDRDVRIAEGQSVTLQGPMRVVAATTSQFDHGEGESGKVDVVVGGGRFQTHGDGAGGDRVVFESTAKDSSNGDDWGSIVVTDAAEAILEDADIGFAVRPLNLVAADTAEVRRSYLHHYNEEAILDWNGSVIEDNVIERGVGFDVLGIATTGIHCIAGEPVISGNEIGQQRLYGIRWHGSESFCNASVSQTPTKTVTIMGNTLTGDGEEVGIAGSAGIFLEWFCQYYQGEIHDNLVTQWSGRGMHIYQAADVDLGCNRFIDNRVGIRYERVGGKMKSYEGNVWLTRNEMRSSRTWNVALDDNVGMRWYDRAGGGSAAESNAMERETTIHPNAELRMQYVADVDFGATSWKEPNGTVLTDSTAIRATILGGLGDVLLSPILTSEDVCSSASARVRGGETVVIGDSSEEGRPTKWEFRAEPVVGDMTQVAVELAVPVGERARVQVVVYDVRGRRVASLGDHPLDPGRYRFRWDGRDGLGRPVAAGVYFARATTSRHSVVAKLVIVR